MSNAKPLGIPYAKADVTDGTYGVTCPVCGERFAVKTDGSEDDVTKQPGRSYADHYDKEHT